MKSPDTDTCKKAKELLRRSQRNVTFKRTVRDLLKSGQRERPSVLSSKNSSHQDDIECDVTHSDKGRWTTYATKNYNGDSRERPGGSNKFQYKGSRHEDLEQVLCAIQDEDEKSDVSIELAHYSASSVSPTLSPTALSVSKKVVENKQESSAIEDGVLTVRQPGNKIIVVIPNAKNKSGLTVSRKRVSVLSDLTSGASCDEEKSPTKKPSLSLNNNESAVILRGKSFAEAQQRFRDCGKCRVHVIDVIGQKRGQRACNRVQGLDESDLQSDITPDIESGVIFSSGSDSDGGHQRNRPIRARQVKKAKRNFQKKSSGKADTGHRPAKASARKDRLRTACVRLQKAEGLQNLGSLENVRQRLHISSIPDVLPCREAEFSQIKAYVRGNLTSKCGGCIYISGVPGTGKTAVTQQVIKKLRVERSVPKFVFVDVNAMKLTEPAQVFCLIHGSIFTAQNSKNGSNALPKTSAALAIRRLEAFFAEKQKRALPVVLLIDEVDLLWTKKQDVLYQIFEWSTYAHAQLTVLAIANTMDLPERALSLRVASRLGMIRVCYQTYTFQQLETILRSRLDGLNGVSHAAVQLVARKVAAVSGDARRALELCRRAAEVAMREGPDVLLSIQHVNAALQETASAAYMMAIKHASWHEKAFLRAAIVEFKKTGLEDLGFGPVAAHHAAYCLQEGHACPSREQLAVVCDRLAAMRLIVSAAAARPSKRGRYRKLRLNVSPEDILLVLD